MEEDACQVRAELERWRRLVREKWEERARFNEWRAQRRKRDDDDKGDGGEGASPSMNAGAAS